jgi:hypothetical protein
LFTHTHTHRKLEVFYFSQRFLAAHDAAAIDSCYD